MAAGGAQAGDIIRLSKNVFKFCLIDESVRDDEAMVAFREASLGRIQQLAPAPT